MKKRISHIVLGLLFMVLCINTTKAQQLPIYGQFYLNKYINNPAFAGTEKHFNVTSNHRYQWVGITDAPRTYTLSINGPTKDHKGGLGGFLYTDHVGPTRRTGAQLSYTHHLKINDNIKLALSLSAGLLEWNIDGGKISLDDMADPAMSNVLMKTLVPDAKFGFLLYGDNWHFGGAAPNLLQNKLNLSNISSPTPGLNKLEDHYVLHGGYKYALNNDLLIDPYIVIRYVSPAPVQVELISRVVWKNMVWGGLGFRTNDAATIMLGYTFKENLSIGYSYDFTTSNLNNYSTGSHGFIFRILFNQEEGE